MLTVVHDAESANEDDGAGRRSLLDEIVRIGYQRAFVSAVDFAFDATRDIFDAGDVGNRGAAELLNNARHNLLKLIRLKLVRRSRS